MNNERKTVLVADPHRDSRQMSMRLIQQEGYAIADADSARNLLLWLKENTPELIFITDDLLVYKGYRILPCPLCPEVPYVVTTRDTARAKLQKLVHKGAADVLIMPLDRTLLQACLRVLIGEPEYGVEANRRMFFRQRLSQPVQAFDGCSIVDVSERGLGLESRKEIPTGSAILLELDFWDAMGVEPPVGRVLYCENVGNEKWPRYRVGVLLVGLDSKTQKALRKWLYRNQLSKARSS